MNKKAIRNKKSASTSIKPHFEGALSLKHTKLTDFNEGEGYLRNTTFIKF